MIDLFKNILNKQEVQEIPKKSVKSRLLNYYLDFSKATHTFKTFTESRRKKIGVGNLIDFMFFTQNGDLNKSYLVPIDEKKDSKPSENIANFVTYLQKSKNENKAKWTPLLKSVKSMKYGTMCEGIWDVPDDDGKVFTKRNVFWYIIPLDNLSMFLVLEASCPKKISSVYKDTVKVFKSIKFEE